MIAGARERRALRPFPKASRWGCRIGRLLRPAAHEGRGGGHSARRAFRERRRHRSRQAPGDGGAPGKRQPRRYARERAAFPLRGACPGDSPRGALRPGIVHRLDKDTSGVIIAAKNPRAHEFLAAQFHDRTVRKRYLAMVQGWLPARERARGDAYRPGSGTAREFTVVPAGGRARRTRYRVLRTFLLRRPAPGSQPDSYALVLCMPRTGRTHQLRVHMRHAGARPSWGTRSTASLIRGSRTPRSCCTRRACRSSFPGTPSRGRSRPRSRRFRVRSGGSSELLSEEGLYSFSIPTLDGGPWPGKTRTSSPRESSFLRTDSRSSPRA